MRDGAIIKQNITIIKPTSGWRALALEEFWRYRELLVFLAWRDLASRYKQTALGVLWVLIQPLVSALIFALIFGIFLGVDTDSNIPYTVFVLSAMTPWTLYAGTLTHASNSTVTAAEMIKKVYFPRIVLPLSAGLSVLVDFALALLALFGIIVLTSTPLSGNVIWLPLFVLMGWLAMLGLGVALSGINVIFRDVRHTIPFMTQMLMWLTPVAYPLSVIPDHVLDLYMLNPLAQAINGARWALVGEGVPPDTITLMSFALVLPVLFIGVMLFRRTERIFAEIA